MGLFRLLLFAANLLGSRIARSSVSSKLTAN